MPEREWTQDEIDEVMLNDEPMDDGEDCGRWRDGKLSKQCASAGTEFCDWICPIGLRARY